MLPVEHGTTAKYEKLGSESRAVVRKTLHGLRLLIIDETSMISSLLLTYIHLRLCEVTGNQSLFGGISVLLFGDLLQLPPVKGNAPYIELSSEEIRTKLESVGSVNLWTTFEYDELTINVRQSSDQIYSNLLSRIRIGQPSNFDIELLQTRLISKQNAAEQITELYQQLVATGKHPVCLLSKVDACKQVNEKMLNQLDVPIVVLKSIDEMDGINSKKVAERAVAKLHHLKADASRTAGLETELKVGLGARVMLRRNMDMEAGFVNGSIGTIKEFVYDSNGNIYELVIHFDSGKDLSLARCNHAFELMKGIYVHRKQFPISLSYAITVHKCQGLSLECAVIDVGKSVFGTGMTYVALSRVTTLEGLYLIDLCSSKIVADVKSIAEYNRLRSMYRPDLPSIQIKLQNLNTDKYFTCLQIDSNFAEHNDRSHSSVEHSLQNLSIQYSAFSNDDHVSCYANSIVQVILHVPLFRNCINNLDASKLPASSVTNQLQRLLNEIDNKKSLLSVISLRAAVDDKYSNVEQQDSYEFLFDLLSKLSAEHNMLPQLVTGVEGEEERCCRYPQCGNKSLTGHDPFQVMRLHFPEMDINDHSPIEFKQLIQQWFATDRLCQLCGASTERQTVVRSAPQFLFISFCLFQRANERINRPIRGFTANDVRFGGKKYRTVGAVCHAGASTQSGHYWCVVRGKTGWLRFNDDIVTPTARFVLNLKNVYMLLLQQINNTEE